MVRWNPKTRAACRRVDALDEQCIARGAADALAESVGDASGQHAGPARGRGHHSLAHSRQPVPGGHEWFAAHPVRQRTQRDLGQRRRPLRRLPRPPPRSRARPPKPPSDRSARVDRAVHWRRPATATPPTGHCHVGERWPAQFRPVSVPPLTLRCGGWSSASYVRNRCARTATPSPSSSSSTALRPTMARASASPVP
jgi:hypothetical protein